MNNEEQILCAEKPERFFSRASAADFQKIPGSPISYWVNECIRKCFHFQSIGANYPVKSGLTTGDKSRFVRFWAECELRKTNFGAKCGEFNDLKWFPLNAGGTLRKWYGNRNDLINWEEDGREIKAFKNSTIRSPQFYFCSGVTWTDISSSFFAARFLPTGSIFENTGSLVVSLNDDAYLLLGVLASSVAKELIDIMNPTLHYGVGEVSRLPLVDLTRKTEITLISKQNISIGKCDWDSYETSWEFTSLPLLQSDYRRPTLKATYHDLRANWQEMTIQMQCLEEENNRIFIEAYGLQDELTPEVPLNEITLTCNPHYRYSNSKNAEELELLLLADTMKEFISYAVGCMFGRYSLDKPGLILANQGETIEDYWKHVRAYQNLPTSNCPLPTDSIFPPDADNVIPILDGDWFTDDISERFRKFLRITFGEEHYEENLKFIEVALGKDIRKYFLKDFYNDHVRRYKKRPIYWLFSSSKGSFNALIYMHRYRSDTVSVVLNYLREFRVKLTTQKNHLEAVSIIASASPGEKTKALKEIESLRKMIEELESYEREILYPLATEQLEIDLDDGVKVNYQKFGPALKKIPGLDTKEE